MKDTAASETFKRLNPKAGTHTIELETIDVEEHAKSTTESAENVADSDLEVATALPFEGADRRMEHEKMVLGVRAAFQRHRNRLRRERRLERSATAQQPKSSAAPAENNTDTDGSKNEDVSSAKQDTSAGQPEPQPDQTK